MPLPKPASKIDWTDGNALKVTEPTSGKKLLGWTKSERPPFQFMNWLFFNLDEWIDYLESVTDAFIGYQSIYAAFVGTGSLATHANINAAVADVPAGSKILVISSATVNTIQSLSKDKLEVDFLPSVIYTKGTAATAIQVQADRCMIRGGEFALFSGGGDAAIIIDSGSDFTKIRDTHFRGCTLDVSDLAATSSIEGTSTET